MSETGRRAILPPHVLEAIARNGSPEERRWAEGVIRTDARFRGDRAAEPKPVSPASETPATGAAKEGHREPS